MKRDKTLFVVSIGTALWAVVATILWLSTQQRLNDTELQYAQIEAHTRVLERQVLDLEVALEKAEAKSIDRIAEDANRLLFEGWDSLLDEFKQRLDETKQKLKPQQGGSSNNSLPNQDEQT